MLTTETANAVKQLTEASYGLALSFQPGKPDGLQWFAEFSKDGAVWRAFGRDLDAALWNAASSARESPAFVQSADLRPKGCICREFIGGALKIEAYCPAHN